MSNNTIRYTIYKGDDEVGYHTQNVLCKRCNDNLMEYQPASDYTIVCDGYEDYYDGYYDDVDVKKALAAENSMRDYVQSKYGDLVKRIEDTKDLSKDDEEKLNAAIKDWKQNGSY